MFGVVFFFFGGGQKSREISWRQMSGHVPISTFMKLPGVVLLQWEQSLQEHLHAVVSYYVTQRLIATSRKGLLRRLGFCLGYGKGTSKPVHLHSTLRYRLARLRNVLTIDHTDLPATYTFSLQVEWASRTLAGTRSYTTEGRRLSLRRCLVLHVYQDGLPANDHLSQLTTSLCLFVAYDVALLNFNKLKASLS